MSAAAPRRADRPGHRTREPLAAAILGQVFLWASALVIAVPFVVSFLTSFRTPADIARNGVGSLPASFTLENYAALLEPGRGFARAIWVTALVTVTIVVVQVFCSILAAYAFARLRFPGRTALFWTYLATLMVPAVVTMIPLYLMFADLHLTNTFWGLVLPMLRGSPYAVFLLRQQFLSVPRELVDAALIDGAGHWRILWGIVAPISRPVIATLIVITAVSQWNGFLWPLIVTSGQQWQMITIATANLQTQYSGNWTLVTAATTISLAPLIVLFVIFQHQIVRSLAIRGNS